MSGFNQKEQLFYVLKDRRFLLLLMPLLLTPAAYAENIVMPEINPKPEALPETMLDTIIVTASRSNIEQEKSPQTVQIIEQEEIEQQLQISSNSSDVLSNLLPSYTPSRGKMNGSGETLRGRTPLIMIDGVPQSNPLRPTGRGSLYRLFNGREN